MDWARGKPILSAAGPAPRMFVAPKGAVYVGNFLGLRGSMYGKKWAKVIPIRSGKSGWVYFDYLADCE
jgi:hypothetical protein